MNRRFSLLFSGFLLLLLAGSIFFLLPSKKDKVKLDRMRAVIAGSEEEMKGIQQQRSNVRKEMVAGLGDKRLLTRISAEESIVDIEKKEGTYEFIERLSGVTYVSPETLYPNHVVRVIKADTALYHHRNEQITADHVMFYRYLLPQQEIPSSFEGMSSTMQGEGDNLVVDLKGNRSYRLSHVRGQISQINKMMKAEKINLEN